MYNNFTQSGKYDASIWALLGAVTQSDIHVNYIHNCAIGICLGIDNAANPDKSRT